MKQSVQVRAATRRALDRLSKMSKEEIDARLSKREIGAVGRALLESGTLECLLQQNKTKWTSDGIIITNHISTLSMPEHAADTSVRYALASTHNSEWSFMPALSKASSDCFSFEVKLWEEAA